MWGIDMQRTCNKCGNSFDSKETHCPFCNTKIAVDFKNEYSAYPNKKYYLNSPSSLKSRIGISITYFMVYAIIAVPMIIELFSANTIPTKIFLGVIFFFITVMIFLLFINIYTNYMIWDGNDKLIIYRLFSREEYRVSKILYVTNNIEIVSTILRRPPRINYWLAVISTGQNNFVVFNCKEMRDFFNHFGIQFKAH